MPINVSHTPISAYGRAAYESGRNIAAREDQAMFLRQRQMALEQEARNRAFTLQDAASRRAERTQMAGLERQGRLDLAGFEAMKQQRQTTEQNLTDWESLADTMSEPEYKRGLISIRSGKTPQALKQEQIKPPGNIYRASDKDALFNMATEYAYAAPEAKGWEWGEPYRNQGDLIKQYKQFLMDNHYSDLDNQQDRNMLEFQWEEAMAADWDKDGRNRLRWNPASPEVQRAREEMRAEPNSDIKAEVGNYLAQLEQEGGKGAMAAFNKKWVNPANRTVMMAQLRQRYGNAQ